MSDGKIPINVVRKGTTKNKLTIAKDRIELKLRSEVDAQGEAWLVAFAEKVVEAVIATNPQQTLRGQFREGESQKGRLFRIHLETGDHSLVEGLSFSSEQMGLPEPKGIV